MSKVFRAVGKVAGVVASVAAFIPGGQPVAAIAATVAAVANIGAQLTAKKPPARGSTSQILIGANMPIPYVMGRTYAGGNLIHDTGYGATLKKVPNPYRALTFVYSGAGPIDSFESFQADFTSLGTGGGGAVGGYYSNFMWIARQLGQAPESAALAANFSGEPGWSGAHKLSGFSAAKFSLKFDKEGEVFAGGVPQLGAILKGVKTYDPRLDSTYPGGSGAHRIANEATWAWSENPALHAIAYAYGRFQNGEKVFGIDMGAPSIDLPAFVAWANVCDANGWKIGGTIFEPDDKWANLKLICEAGSAEPCFVGGMLSVRYDAPRTSLDTVTIDDLADGEVIVPAMRAQRERINGIVPRYRSEAHLWEMVQAARVQSATYLAEDGEERTEELPFKLVQGVNQAAQLAAYELVDRREFGPIVLVCKPRLYEYGVGDALTLNLPEAGLSNRLAVIVGRTPDPLTGTVMLELMSETAAKHGYALGLTGTAPPTPSIVAPADRDAVSYGSVGVDFENVTGATKPEDYATTGDNLIANPSLAENDDSWTFFGGSFRSTGAASDPSIGRIQFPAGTASSAAANNNEKRLLNGRDKLYLSGASYMQAGFTGAFAAVISWWKGDGTASSILGESTLSIVPAAGDIWMPFAGSVTPPADASKFIASIGRASASGIAYATNLRVAKTEPAADVTSMILGAAEIVIQCDVNGTPLTGQLPRNEFYKLSRNGADVTAEAAWSEALVSGGATDSFPAAGQYQITALSAADSKVRLTAVRAGLTRDMEVRIVKQNAQPNTGGSTSGGTSATLGINASGSSNSMFVIGDGAGNSELVLNTGTGGVVTLTGKVYVGAEEASPTGTFKAFWIWQRWNGSAWVDIDSEVESEPDAGIGSYFDSEFGTVFFTAGIGEMSVGKTVTGLTASAQHRFRLRVRCGTSGKLLYFSTSANLGATGT